MAGGGSKPGERRGGRQKGTPNKSTQEIRELARQYAPEAVKELARLAREAQSEQTRAYAINVLLDRAYGKPVQPIANDDDNPFKLLVDHLDGLTRGVPSGRHEDARRNWEKQQTEH